MKEITDFVGAEYRNCYDMVRMFYLEHLGIKLLKYTEDYDEEMKERIILNNYSRYGFKMIFHFSELLSFDTDLLQVYDVIGFEFRNKLHHFGISIGYDRVLHCMDGPTVAERWHSKMERRAKYIFRHARYL